MSSAHVPLNTLMIDCDDALKVLASKDTVILPKGGQTYFELLLLLTDLVARWAFLSSSSRVHDITDVFNYLCKISREWKSKRSEVEKELEEWKRGNAAKQWKRTTSRATKPHGSRHTVSEEQSPPVGDSSPPQEQRPINASFPNATLDVEDATSLVQKLLASQIMLLEHTREMLSAKAFASVEQLLFCTEAQNAKALGMIQSISHGLRTQKNNAERHSLPPVVLIDEEVVEELQQTPLVHIQVDDALASKLAKLLEKRSEVRRLALAFPTI